MAVSPPWARLWCGARVRLRLLAEYVFEATHCVRARIGLAGVLELFRFCEFKASKRGKDLSVNQVEALGFPSEATGRMARLNMVS